MKIWGQNDCPTSRIGCMGTFGPNTPSGPSFVSLISLVAEVWCCFARWLWNLTCPLSISPSAMTWLVGLSGVAGWEVCFPQGQDRKLCAGDGLPAEGGTDNWDLEGPSLASFPCGLVRGTHGLLPVSVMEELHMIL